VTVQNQMQDAIVVEWRTTAANMDFRLVYSKVTANIGGDMPNEG